MAPRKVLKHIRFLQKAETQGLNPDICWNWKGPHNSNGYGRFVHENRHILAHRVSYQLFVGNITDGMNVCHACDNRLCVNPHHLWLGSQSDNLRDAFAKGRHRVPNTCGVRNGNRKLGLEDAAKIREMVAGGAKKFVVAALFNVSPSTVSDIVNLKTWREAA